MGNKNNIKKEKKEKIVEKNEDNGDLNEDLNDTNLNIEIKNEKILVNDSFSGLWLDNSFCVFKSFNNILYLIYADKKNSIISYNLIDEKKINEIKKAHRASITNFRHFFDKNSKRDFIMTISAHNNNIKIWNFSNFERLLSINSINKKGWLNSACFLNKDNNIFLVTSNCNREKPVEPIKIFDLKGNKIKELDDSLEFTYFIDIYEDKIKNKNYIIAGNKGLSKSYDYDDNKVYHKYIYEDLEDSYHMSILIDNSEEIIKMIESSCSGRIFVWNFHSGELIKIIDAGDRWLFSIGFIENNILYVACKNGKIEIIDVSKGKRIIDFQIHEDKVLTIKKISHPNYGECLISKDLSNIKLLMYEK